MDFLKIDYLKNGTVRQKRTYEVLTTHSVFSKIEKFTPILVGTIPINIDTEKSDLDIICYWTKRQEFTSTIIESFRGENNFTISEKEKAGKSVIVAKFNIDEFPLEIYGQNTPVVLQNGYRHMIAEYRILQEKGEEFRLQIIELKKLGYKTEPAFAKLLGLSNNPYDELLK